MCGIAGFTQKGWTSDPNRINAATATLSHRGPDQQGVFFSRLCSLGATRLKILDLAAGDQPMTSSDGDTVIVFNGEIYNHLELRPELEALGYQFHSHCDTETVLYAFLAWDVNCFARMRGMFAVALWRKSTRRLILARDRMGIKPLYLAKYGEDLLFGSELKAILIHPEVERRLSMEGLDCYLSLNYVPCPWTLVNGVEKLPPGCWYEWLDGQVRTEAYWRLPHAAAQPRDIESAKQELDSLLQQSVQEHLLSDVPLGVWLSGGLDSSTILHYAAATNHARLKTFSISFEGRSFDESEHIQQVVAHYGTEHEQLDLNPQGDLTGAIEQFAYYSDEPSADAGALPVWFLSRLCKTHATVALSGEGADEIFAGYLTYRANQLARTARKLPLPALKLALASVRSWPVSDEKISLEYKLKRFLEGCLLPPERAHVHWNGTFSEPAKAALLRRPLPGAMGDILEGLAGAASLAGGGSLSPYLAFDQQYYLADDILVKSDRMSMAHSVEVRPPFLDHRIVEFAATLPDSMKMKGSRQKLLLKELMKDKLPASILNRKKVGFDIPAHEWLRGTLRPLLVATLKEGLTEHADLFRADTIENYLQLHLERKANLGYHLWGLMILFLWMKQWRIQSTPAATRSLPVLIAEEAGTST